MSSGDETKITKTMERHCEAVFHLNDYSNEDIIGILEQRIALYGLLIEEQAIFIKSIVDVVNCEVRRCVELLHWSYKCCRAMGEDTITIKHLNKALHIKR